MFVIWILLIAIFAVGVAFKQMQRTHEEDQRQWEGEVDRERQEMNARLETLTGQNLQLQRQAAELRRQEAERRRQDAEFLRRARVWKANVYLEGQVDVRELEWETQEAAAEWLDANAPEQGWDLVFPVSEATPPRIWMLESGRQHLNGRLGGRGELALCMRPGTEESLLPRGKVVVVDAWGRYRLVDEGQIEMTELTQAFAAQMRRVPPGEPQLPAVGLPEAARGPSRPPVE